MSEHRCDPGGTEGKECIREPQRPAVVRRLDEEVVRVAPEAEPDLEIDEDFLRRIREV